MQRIFLRNLALAALLSFTGETSASEIPKEHAYRVPTLNHSGYMFTVFDPVTKKFLRSIEINPSQAVFEVGGAYGNVAEAALDLGVSAYYLNDKEPLHLKLFVQKLQAEGKGGFFSSLSLVPGECPEEVAIPENNFDAILVNKVLHFFTPEAIDSFVSWLYKGVKPGGAVYVLTISPYYHGHEELLENYSKKKRDGVRFPGYVAEYRKSQPADGYREKARPDHLLFMELETLQKLFLEHGFEIVEEFSLSIVDLHQPEWGPGDDMVGIIAKKPK